MTDERADATLEAALAGLPRGAGVVFRHHRTADPARRTRYEAVRRICRARRLVLVLAGDPRTAVGWRADGAHGPSRQSRAAKPLIRTAPAHHARDLVAARRGGADIAFLSPVFATRSHPGARVLGPVRFGLLARGAGLDVMALGGMTRRRRRRLRSMGAAGWAAIDGLSPACDKHP